MKNLIEFIRVRDEYAKKGENRANVTLQLTFMEMNLSEIPDVSLMNIDITPLHSMLVLDCEIWHILRHRSN